MQNLYECRVCGQLHLEPAHAVVGFRAICFTCELEQTPRTAVWAVAA